MEYSRNIGDVVRSTDGDWAGDRGSEWSLVHAYPESSFLVSLYSREPHAGLDKYDFVMGEEYELQGTWKQLSPGLSPPTLRMGSLQPSDGGAWGGDGAVSGGDNAG